MEFIRKEFKGSYEELIAAIENGRDFCYKNNLIEVEGHGYGTSLKYLWFERYFKDGSHTTVVIRPEDLKEIEIVEILSV